MTFQSETYLRALDSVSTWISGIQIDAREITNGDLGSFEGYSAGWVFPSPVEEVLDLRLLIDSEFPYSMPRVFIRGNNNSMSWPHVEKNGRLCLAGDGAAVSTMDPVAVVENVLYEANCLIEENSAGLNTEDFLDDFKAYWRRSIQPDPPEVRFNLSREKSRLVSACHGESFYFVADNSQSVLRWMDNKIGKDETRSTFSAAVIYLDSLPLPAQYPSSCNELRKLVRGHSKDGLKVFDQLLSKEPSRAAIVFMGKNTIGREVYFGAIIKRPHRVTKGKRRGAYPYAKGFRPGKIPAEVLSLHYCFERAVTEDVDAYKTRLVASLPTSLEEKRVSIIGCGSLGSSVAQLLAKSGIGKLHLIDPESIGWENIGRHELGASSVRKNKALSLAQRIKSHVPQIRDCSHSTKRWIQAYAKDDKLFSESDLVILTTGDWNSDSALSDMCRVGEVVCPILYGWMEAYAGAAHAVLIHKNKGCFRCGFDDVGTHLTPATMWTADPDHNGCGGGTSIYGAIELSQAAAIVSQLAIDALIGKSSPPIWRSWLAPKNEVYSNGGLWNPEWSKLYGDPGNGGYLTANVWPKQKNCSCNRD